jgi:hypothetical protein
MSNFQGCVRHLPENIVYTFVSCTHEAHGLAAFRLIQERASRARTGLALDAIVHRFFRQRHSSDPCK